MHLFKKAAGELGSALSNLAGFPIDLDTNYANNLFKEVSPNDGTPYFNEGTFRITKKVAGKILSDAFSDLKDKGIKHIISENATKIEDNAFKDFKNLESVQIPSIQKIGENAFGGCTELKLINLGDSLSTISKDAFNGCISLEKIIFKNIEYNVSYPLWGEILYGKICEKDGSLQIMLATTINEIQETEITYYVLTNGHVNPLPPTVSITSSGKADNNLYYTYELTAENQYKLISVYGLSFYNAINVTGDIKENKIIIKFDQNYSNDLNTDQSFKSLVEKIKNFMPSGFEIVITKVDGVNTIPNEEVIRNVVNGVPLEETEEAAPPAEQQQYESDSEADSDDDIPDDDEYAGDKCTIL